MSLPLPTCVDVCAKACYAVRTCTERPVGTLRRVRVMLTSQLRPLVPSGTGTDSDTSPSVCVQAYASWSCPLPTFGSAVQQCLMTTMMLQCCKVRCGLTLEYTRTMHLVCCAQHLLVLLRPFDASSLSSSIGAASSATPAAASGSCAGAGDVSEEGGTGAAGGADAVAPSDAVAAAVAAAAAAALRLGAWTSGARCDVTAECMRPCFAATLNLRCTECFGTAQSVLHHPPAWQRQGNRP